SRVHARVIAAAARIRLEAHGFGTPQITELPGDLLDAGCIRHGRQESTIFGFEDVARTVKPLPREQRGEDAALGGAARVQPLTHRAVGVERPETGRLRASEAEGAGC